MYILRTIFISLLTVSSLLYAETFLTIHKHTVNPACIKLMQPWLSERANSIAIIKSVVLDTCQNSNIAFKGQKPTINDEGTVSYYEDPKDVYSYFAYRFLGKTSKGIIYLSHKGTIGAYTITKESIITDLQKNTRKSVSVINKIGDTVMPCFKDAIIENDSLVVKSYRFDPSKQYSKRGADTIVTAIIK